jgi:hypothetical protein
MPGRPVSGRVFFEQVIRDNLDIGRPGQIALVFEPARGLQEHPDQAAAPDDLTTRAGPHIAA